MAIGNDTKLQISAPTTGAITLAYTCGAGTKLLVVLQIGENNTAAPGNVTYNGVALTQAAIGSAIGGAECYARLDYLINPPTGAAYNIYTANANGANIRLEAASFTSAVDVSYFNSGKRETNSNIPAVTINSVPAGGMCISVLGHGYKAAPTGRSHTTIYETDEGAWSSNGQYGLIGSLGNVTMSWTFADTDDVAMIMAAFQEVSAGGPTNLKTVEDLAKASVKVVNGLAMGSIKTFNGVAYNPLNFKWCKAA